jgi:hypothetical protein
MGAEGIEPPERTARLLYRQVRLSHVAALPRCHVIRPDSGTRTRTWMRLVNNQLPYRSATPDGDRGIRTPTVRFARATCYREHHVPIVDAPRTGPTRVELAFPRSTIWCSPIELQSQPTKQNAHRPGMTSGQWAANSSHRVEMSDRWSFTSCPKTARIIIAVAPISGIPAIHGETVQGRERARDTFGSRCGRVSRVDHPRLGSSEDHGVLPPAPGWGP